MKLLRMITTLSIIHNPTFWVAHDAYLSSRFKLLQVLEKYTLLGAIVRQYEKSKPGVTVRSALEETIRKNCSRKLLQHH